MFPLTRARIGRAGYAVFIARGDTETAFRAAALADGIELSGSYKLPWINQKGHFGLPHAARSAAGPLHGIFLALGGDAVVYAEARGTQLRGDLLHEPTGTLIEIDEHQHFTSHRLTSLELYPAGAQVGFDVAEYRELCRVVPGRADRYRAAKEARGFTGVAGRARQRAYYDSLRDLAAPPMGRGPVIRVPSIDGDGARAYAAARVRLREAVGLRPLG